MNRRSDVVITPHEIKVSVRGVPHLVLRRADVVGIQSYIKNIGPVVPIYFIEITTRTSEIVCDYSDRGLWEEILGAMADARMFDERVGEVVD